MERWHVPGRTGKKTTRFIRRQGRTDPEEWDVVLVQWRYHAMATSPVDSAKGRRTEEHLDAQHS